MQILNTYYNNSFIWLLVPFLFVWIPISLTIVCAFASIRFHSFLSFFEYVPFPVLVNNCCVILVVTMVPTAAIYEQSKQLCWTLKNDLFRERNKILRKELKALRPFGVRVGFIQAIPKVSILLSYYFMSNHVFTLLITFPQDSVIP